jgi:DcuC family C4-dicarboxylate transporter
MGVSEALINVAKASGSLTLLAGAFPWALSVLSGSGSGPILTFAQTFLAQMVGDADVVTLAAMACFGGAFGRTTSPVAAVVVYGASLVGVSPVLLVRRFLPALAAGAAVAFRLALR